MHFWLPCSPISPHVHGPGGGAKKIQLFSFHVKTKVVQNVNRMSERQIERQNYFSAKLSKQKLFRMSTGCQKVSQTDGKIYSAPGRQSDRDRMTV